MKIRTKNPQHKIAAVVEQTVEQEAPVPQQRQALWSISDPNMADYFGTWGPNLSGELVNEFSALGLAAFYRAVSIIAGTIAGMPLKSYRDMTDGTRMCVPSLIDDPYPFDGMTQYEWIELIVTHILLYGNAYLLKVYNVAGGLIGLQPIHPYSVSVQLESPLFFKTFRVVLANGELLTLTSAEILHIPGLGTNGVQGLGLLQLMRNSIGISLAGERSAANAFGQGTTVAALVTAPDDTDPDEVQIIQMDLDNRLSGSRNAGKVKVVNRDLDVKPLGVNARDMQFIESRKFQVEDVARFTGIPKVLLAEDGASTWGTGIAELMRGMARFTFQPITTRIEARLSTVLAKPRFAEFDYKELLEASPAEEVALLLEEVAAGVITKDEARKVMGYDPMPMSAQEEPSAMPAGPPMEDMNANA